MLSFDDRARKRARNKDDGIAGSLPSPADVRVKVSDKNLVEVAKGAVELAIQDKEPLFSS